MKPDQTNSEAAPPEPDFYVCCARCGGDTDFERCDQCEDGYTFPGELYESDPLWYDEDETEPCGTCGGVGGFRFCGNTDAWCEANPLPGRKGVKRGTLERVACESSSQKE